MASAEFGDEKPPVILTLTDEEARALKAALGQLRGHQDGTYAIYDALFSLLASEQ